MIPTIGTAIKPIASKVISIYKYLDRSIHFTLQYTKAALAGPYEWNELFRQCFIIGYQSLPLVAITGLILGIVLTIQSRPTLAEFGATSWLPAMVTTSIFREVGPVITGLLFAGKIGSAIGAELAAMRVSEQIDAIEVSGVNTYQYLIAPRVTATITMLVILTIFSMAFSMFGTYLGMNLNGVLQFRIFYVQALAHISFIDLISSLIKSAIFGFAIGLIATYQGFYATKGTSGVAKAANKSVVYASLAIFIIDVIAVQVTAFFR